AARRDASAPAAAAGRPTPARTTCLVDARVARPPVAGRRVVARRPGRRDVEVLINSATAGALRRVRSHLMKRTLGLLLVAAVVASGLWAALAFASHRRYNGPAGSAPHAGVEFGAHFKK